ncbi:hypothetical protein AX17_001051 [Amanita inopinata Kibby_2008]|nr:hypothetical protein AX17_001051 [Amanita inopinata Kibby_2008]
MSYARQCLGRLSRLPARGDHVRNARCMAMKTIEADACGIPLKPTWSVEKLLSSYPMPVISSATLKRIHELSALSPPEEGSPEHQKLQRDMGDLIKLVEAVKLVNTDQVRFIERDLREDWDRALAHTNGDTDEGEAGRSLLKYASRTVDGFYAVDADRKR